MKQSAEVYAEQEKSLFIVVLKPQEPFDGWNFEHRKFFIDNPHCDVREMAWATSMQCRFTGHVMKRYSVAEHCVLVADLVTEPECQALGGGAYEGLMHDAHEGYISDFAAPWKAKIPQYRDVEAVVETAMRKQFGLPAEHSKGVKFADWLALFIEAEQLLGPGVSEDWLQPQPGTRDLALEIMHRSGGRYIVHGFDPYESYQRFLGVYYRLAPNSVL